MGKNILLITYYYPPTSSVGAVRPGGMAKYLSKLGYEIVVLSTNLSSSDIKGVDVVRADCDGDVYDVLATKLKLNKVRGIRDKFGDFQSSAFQKRTILERIIRTAKSIVTYPDEAKTWYSNAVKKGIEICKKQDISVIISTSPPIITHLIAYKLKKRFNKPWLADFRDLWSYDPYYHFGKLRRFLDERLEKKVISCADAIVTVTEPYSKVMGEVFSDKRIFTVTNGFDPDIVKKEKLDEMFTITYTGKMLGGRYMPDKVFSAVRKLLDNGMVDPKKIRINFYGPKRNWLEDEIARYDLSDIVKQHGKIHREEVLSLQRRSQILLLFFTSINPMDKAMYTGKLFEYIAAHRPILAVGALAGVATDLLDKTRSGVFFAKTEDLEEYIYRSYKEYLNSGEVSYKGKEEEINKYSHYEMAKQFFGILDKII